MDDHRNSDPATSQSLRDLCARAGIRPRDGQLVPEVPIAHLTNDSRQVRRGSCFVAVKGEVVDGHSFLSQAIASGASALIVDASTSVDKVSPFQPEQQASACATVQSTSCATGPVRLDAVAIIRVTDTREAVARLAAAYHGVQRGGPRGLRLVGITGTNGKSTVAWMVREILKKTGQKCALLGTIEYDLGGSPTPSNLTTPDPIQLCEMLATAYDAGVRFGVLEVSSHALEQRRCDGLTFDAAVFTNLSGDHLDYHETMDTYLAAKARLLKLCDDRSTAIINVDDHAGRRLTSMTIAPCTSYGVDSSDAHTQAVIRSADRTGSEVTLRFRSAAVDILLPLVGKHNVSNALAAAVVCESLGVEHDAIRCGLESITGVPGRLQRVEPDGCPFSVFVDYAHTDAALENVLQAIRPITAGRLIGVFGCGGDRDRTKRPRMAATVERLADVVVVTSDNPRTEDPDAIIKEINAGFSSRPSCAVHVDADRRAAITWAIAHAEPGDTVLIAGKGHENYQILGTERIHFDDVEVAEDALKVVLRREVPA